MANETFTNYTPDEFNLTLPADGDTIDEGALHIRDVKKVIQTTFPSVDSPITATDTELNLLDGVTATTAELNILDGVTATYAELNDMDRSGNVSAVWSPLPVIVGATTAGSFSYSSRLAEYYRVGNMMYIAVDVTTNGASGSPAGNLIINNLPVAAVGGTLNYSLPPVSQQVSAGLASNEQLIPVVLAGTTNVQFNYLRSSDSSMQILQYSDITVATFRVRFAGFYPVG